VTRYTASMSVDPQYIQVGMRVVGSDGEEIGWVKEVRATDILVDRMLARDVYVPLEAIHMITDTSASSAYNMHVVLTIRADSVGDTGWPHPS
jgi:hypothetical protein